MGKRQSEDLISELISLSYETQKLLDMAQRDGFLHPASMNALPSITVRVLLAADRTWQDRRREHGHV